MATTRGNHETCHAEAARMVEQVHGKGDDAKAIIRKAFKSALRT